MRRILALASAALVLLVTDAEPADTDQIVDTSMVEEAVKQLGDF